ncbi:MAG: hypothetical protein F4210_11435 [Holophagales bacterium]|nr:hypothetical protein [Holophagales bacterium]MYF96096.1 hypothetical protein [Holophagales bacterium]
MNHHCPPPQTLRFPCCLLLGITLSTTPLLGERCSVTAGDTVSFAEPQEVFRSLSSLDLAKGEFETTAAYEARKRQLVADHGLDEPLVLRGTYHPDVVRYDADNGHFLLPKYAWNNPTGHQRFYVFSSEPGSWSVLKKDGRLSAYGAHQVVLSAERELTRRTEAVSASGGRATIDLYRVEVYGLFERDAAGTLSFELESWSGYDREAESPSGLMTKMVTVDATPAEAPELKNNLVVGFQASLKEPYAASGLGHFDATLSHRESNTVTYSVIFADIRCVVIAGPDNKVLKVVDRAGVN